MNSTYMCQSLDKVGCAQNKSLILQYPSCITDNLHHHFIRGYFDGDGSIKSSFQNKNREWNFNICSTSMFVEKVKQILKEKLGVHSYMVNVSPNGHCTSTIETSGNEQIEKIFHWLYKDADSSIWMDRKYERFQELLEQNRKKHQNKYIGQKKRYYY